MNNHELAEKLKKLLGQCHSHGFEAGEVHDGHSGADAFYGLLEDLLDEHDKEREEQYTETQMLSAMAAIKLTSKTPLEILASFNLPEARAMSDLPAQGDEAETGTKPVCPFCKSEMYTCQYNGYYESFVYWGCDCDEFKEISFVFWGDK